MSSEKTCSAARRPGLQGVLRWLVNDPRLTANLAADESAQLDSFRLTIFIGMHILCLSALLLPFSSTAIFLCLASYFIRMFFITAFYHRYFSHKSYKAGRIPTFCMAVLGCTAGQRGPLWWASHHRQHHITSDTSEDPHTPRSGFINSHMLWFLRKGYFNAVHDRVRDWSRYPELVWLERLDWVPFILYGAGCYFLGVYLSETSPELGVNGMVSLVWCFLVSTVLLWHGTYTINSMAHRFGSRRYKTRDNSRNNFWLALLTMGEGWHNNHHRYPNSTRQGFYWWEIDMSYYLICLLSALGIFKGIRQVPASIYLEASVK